MKKLGEFSLVFVSADLFDCHLERGILHLLQSQSVPVVQMPAVELTAISGCHQELSLHRSH